MKIINTELLAKCLVDDLFEIGSENSMDVSRVQFMGGQYPDDEIPLGGLAREPLMLFFATSLKEHLGE